MHELRVADVRWLTDDAVCLTFDVPDELRNEYWFTQGQHVTLIHRDGEEELRRSYSICAPAGTGPLRVAVKRVEGGRFSTWATTELRVGQVLGVMTPNGRFSAHVNPAHDKRYGAVAGGSGITPILSNIATVLAVERRSRVTLLNVNRRPSSVMLGAELDALRERHGDRLTIHHVYSREPSPDGRPAGRLDEAALRELFTATMPAGRFHEWLLCGPEGLVNGARAALTELSVSPRRIHHELFAVSDADDGDDPNAPEITCDVTVVLDGRRTELELSSNGPSILDAVLPDRPEAPYSCRDGVCSTCRALVVEGEVRMRRSSGLDSEELADGYALTCQAHPASRRVVLDFDA
ncbi:MAG: phenylacetate-CoA oxygenase/reductase, PaaK subunit [Conexibacter sp.]|nr:phenylacetate-CoA oxygenase/reductase, PaaK subunit [Conexibacter sp.]